VLFSLAEFDENFSSRTIVLADRENGEILPPSGAPLRIVTPGDKRGARSARQVVAIELVSLAKP
jgi:DMSO/TMAO reductase YedYZ molybdopterin-dependent catalytic subunit